MGMGAGKGGGYPGAQQMITGQSPYSGISPGLMNSGRNLAQAMAGRGVGTGYQPPATPAGGVQIFPGANSPRYAQVFPGGPMTRVATPTTAQPQALQPAPAGAVGRVDPNAPNSPNQPQAQPVNANLAGSIFDPRGGQQPQAVAPAPPLSLNQMFTRNPPVGGQTTRSL